VCRGVPARSDVAGEDCDAHERREVHSTQPQQLADDLLDIAEARETESLKDVLIRLARQKKSGSIVMDGRRSISKLPMVNFLFHCADGTWLIECVDTTGVQK